MAKSMKSKLHLRLPLAVLLWMSPSVLHAQSTTLEGMLTAVWGDPPRASRAPAVIEWLLTDDRGAVHGVRIGPEMLQQPRGHARISSG
jgi:hypothetical protein